MSSLLKTGVYQIRCVLDGKVYVGGAYKNFDRRFFIHRKELRAGNHKNQHLQNAWNKYGESAFVFEIVERCLPSECAGRETFWIARNNSTDRRYGYNKSPTGGSPLGTKHPPEYGEAVSERNRRRGPEVRAKIGAASKGRVQSPEARERQASKLRGRKRPPEVVAKIATALRGKKRSPEVLVRMTAANRAREITPELREKLGRANRGRVWSRDIVERRAAPLRGRKRPAEVVAKVRAAHLGRKVSEESKARMSASQKLRFQRPEEVARLRLVNLGRKLTEEHKAKISAGQLKPETRAKKVAAAKAQWERIRNNVSS